MSYQEKVKGRMPAVYSAAGSLQRTSGSPAHPLQSSTWPQAFFSFLVPHSHPATRPSSCPQSHEVPRVTTSRNNKTSSRYCSQHGCWKVWGLRCAASPVWRMVPRCWAGVRGWERLMMHPLHNHGHCDEGEREVDLYRHYKSAAQMLSGTSHNISAK